MKPKTLILCITAGIILAVLLLSLPAFFLSSIGFMQGRPEAVSIESTSPNFKVLHGKEAEELQRRADSTFAVSPVDSLN